MPLGAKPYEAIIKHGGGLALGAVGGYLGAVGGGALGLLGGPEAVPFGAATGEFLGEKAGERMASNLAEADAILKFQAHEAARVLNDPKTYLRPGYRGF